MDANEEFAAEIRAKLKDELRKRAERRGWVLPPDWADSVLDGVQAVFDQQRIEVARRVVDGVANPLLTLRLTCD